MSYTAINISAVIEGEIFLTGCNYQKIFLYLQQILHANQMTGLIIQCNMTKREISKLFEDRKIRTVWDDKEEKWYFSVVDVVGVLTDQPDVEHARNYWKVLKHRLKKEGNKSVTNCNQLKLRASDGKSYKTDVADTEQLFRIIQSIPSPKAEPIKQWIAHVASERIEISDLFGTSVQNVSYHIINILKDKELDENSVIKDYLITASDGKTYNVLCYSLEMILVIGYRVLTINHNNRLNI